ncbi:MAG: hypothetical protein HYW78_03990 [Parcubacteria group bacterium]|nr:hypothetical protein [Parcubacteria group bacterium]
MYYKVVCLELRNVIASEPRGERGDLIAEQMRGIAASFTPFTPRND